MIERVIATASISLPAIASAAAGAAIEDQHISLATLVAVGGIVIPAVWWLSKKFTQIDDNFVAASKRFDSLEEQLNKRPCIAEQPCEHVK